MAFKCGFFTSKNGDRKYSADDMMTPIKSIVSEGIVADNLRSDGLQVQAVTTTDNTLKVLVKAGKGLFFGKWFENDSDYIIQLANPNTIQNRIDSIVIRIDISENVRSGSIEYIAGDTTTGAPPTLTNTDVIKEFRLANITVKANARTITNGDILDTRATQVGFVSNLLQNSNISSLYDNWEYNFNAWLDSVKESLTNTTVLMSFTSRYVTSEEDETVIPIGIGQYRSVLDILQVYINNLICIKDIDYTVDNYNNIILTKPVDKGTEISFVVYKSVDSADAESILVTVENMNESLTNMSTDYENYKTSTNSSLNDFDNRLISTDSKVSTLTNDMTSAKTRLTNLEKDLSAPLWTGGNVMGSGVTITLTKKLSQCKNGIILCWCGYNDGSYSNTRFNFITVPKGLLATLPGNSIPVYNHLIYAVYESGNFEECVKRVDVYDDKIVGFVGNSTDTKSAGMCLRAIYEF